MPAPQTVCIILFLYKKKAKSFLLDQLLLLTYVYLI